jgi:succinyl-diaminopimelate desuccinylase
MKQTDLSLLEKLIAIPSSFPDEKRISLFIDEWVEKNVKCKKTTQRVDKDRENLIYTKGQKSKKTIMLVGHLDTISVAKGWKTEPFKAKVTGDKLFGLGAWDMKAGIYILLQTLKEFEPKNITLKVAFTVDEENYSIGAHKLIDDGYCNDVDFIIVPEPGFVHGDKGITIGRAGRATFTVIIKGVAVHGSYPEKGINAIEQARIFLNEIESLSFAHHKKLGFTKIFPRFIYSKANGFSVPDECEIELDSKLVIPDTPEEMKIKLQEAGQQMYRKRKIAFKPEISFKKRPTPFCSPYEIDMQDKYVKLCKETLDFFTGGAKLFYRDSVADECIFAERLGVPIVTIGPSGGNAHAKNEYVGISSVKRMCQVYLQVLQNLDRIEGKEWR